MTIWADAGAAITAAFGDPEPIIYTGAGLDGDPLAAIRMDERAPDFSGPGQTLREVTYEVQDALFPSPPRNSDTFTHRGRTWHVQQREHRPEIAAWWLNVSDGGPA